MKVKSILTRARSGTPHTFWLFDLDMQHAKPSIGMCRHLSILPVCSDWLYRSSEVFFSNDITTSELRRLTGSLSQCGLRDLTTSTGCSRVWGYTRRPRSASSQARQVRRGRRTRQEWGETPTGNILKKYLLLSPLTEAGFSKGTNSRHIIHYMHGHFPKWILRQWNEKKYFSFLQKIYQKHFYPTTYNYSTL